MRRSASLTISLLLLLTVLCTAAPPSRSAVTGANSSVPKKVKNVKVKSGREVAAKVLKLRENNENVRAALRYFEKKGKPPQIENSFAITGTYSHTSQTAKIFNGLGSLIKASSFTQESRISESGVEIIFVPDYSVEGEWQGTVIANRYDDYGNLAEQYVSQSVLVMPDPNAYSWDEIYEAPVYGGEVQPAVNEPGMYTDYNWGSRREEQPIDYMYVSKNGGSTDHAKIVNANSLQSRRARVRAWARCTFAWCGGAAIGCIAANLWNAEFLAGPCFAAGCITAAVGCSWGTLWQ